MSIAFARLTPRTVCLVAAATVSAAAATAIVQAHEFAGGPPPPLALEMIQRMCDDREARAIGRLAYMQAKIALKPEQRDEWEKFASATKMAVAAFNPCKDGPPAFDDPVALRAKFEQTIEGAYDMYKSIKGAADTFSKSLDADQKRRFAEAVLPPMPPMWR